MRIALISAILLCAGCAVHQPVTANWRLIRQGTGDVLIPPGVKPDLAHRTFAVDLVAGSGVCPPTIRVKGKRVLVTVDRGVLLQQPAGWLATWAAGIESRGCIAAGQSTILADKIAESLPLDPAVAFHLLYANDRQSGQVDIEPPVRLQVVSPIVRAGAAPDAPLIETTETSGAGNTVNLIVKATVNFVGYETAWYAVRSKTAGNGFTIAPLYAERYFNRQAERIAQPATNYLQFSSDAAYYRLFYKSGQTDYTAFLVAAPTRAELDRRIAMLDRGAALCGKLNGELCVAIPRRVAINAIVPVTINGAEAMVAWGASVAEAIRNAGERQPETVLPKLAVSRLYNGRLAAVEFDPSSPAVLKLNLTGGEVISWVR